MPISRPFSIEDRLEELRDKRLHPTVKDKWEQNIYFPLYRVWRDYNPVAVYREARWALQRAKRGWADCDTWSLDWYLAGWLPDALEYLAEHKHGYPNELADEENDPSGDEAMAEWQAIIRQTAEGFRAHNRMKDGTYEDKLGPSSLFRPEGMSKESWAKAKQDRFEAQQELARQDEAVFQLGMGLFVRHFQSLWD